MMGFNCCPESVWEPVAHSAHRFILWASVCRDQGQEEPYQGPSVCFITTSGLPSVTMGPQFITQKDAVCMFHTLKNCWKLVIRLRLALLFFSPL